MTPPQGSAAGGHAPWLAAALGAALAALLLARLPAGALAQTGATPGPARLCPPQTTVAVTGAASPRTALLLRFNGRAVGGGVSGADGSYRLALQVGRERPGTYTVSVAVRESGEELQRFTCEVPGASGAGATPTGAPATPGGAPSSPLLPTPTAIPTPNPQPTNPPITRPASDFDRDGDRRVTCADFDTQAAAREALSAGYVALDEDRDGTPCEGLPAGP